MHIPVPSISVKYKKITLNPFPYIASYIFASPKKDIKKFKIRNRIILMQALTAVFYVSFTSFSQDLKSKDYDLAKLGPTKEQQKLNKEKSLMADNKNFILEEQEVAYYNYKENEKADENLEKSVREIIAKEDKKEEEAKKIAETAVAAKEKKLSIVEKFSEIEIAKEIKDSKDNLVLETKTTETKEEKYESNSKQYFVQIASVYHLKYLKKKINILDEMGYEYTIRDYTTKKGAILKKVLVGPFPGYKEAKAKLSFLNNKLRVKGFVRNFED